MKFKDAVNAVNKDLMAFLKHDHWEVRLGFDLIKQGFSSLFSGFRYWFRWAFALCAIPLIQILYPISIIIRMVKNDSN